MVDLHDRFRCLVDPPLVEPEPMARLQRRAKGVRRRRRARQAGALAVVLLGVLGLTSLVWGHGGLGPIRSPRVVLDQPGSGERFPPAPDGWQTHDEDDIAFHYPAGWSIVADPDGPAVLVGTHPLGERDAQLALFGRPDVSFTADFPADAVAFSIGGDRFRAPGPNEGLGEEMVVDADDAAGDGAPIRARFGKVVSSIHQVAAYAGPEAAAEDWASVEQIAETVITRQPRTGDVPPPPPGPPGFPDGREQPVAAATNEVLRLPGPLNKTDYDVVLLTGDGCAVVSLQDPTDTGGPRPQAGRCGFSAPDADQFDAQTPLVGSRLPIPPPPRAQQPRDASRPLLDNTATPMYVATQVGEQVERVEARLVDGRLTDGEVGDGWALVVAEGRIAWLTAYDADGAELASAFVQ